MRLILSIRAAALLFLSAILCLAAAVPASADVWIVDKDKSRLTFEVQQGGGTLQGSFTSWDAAIDFDPASPETSVISAQIQPASASTGNAQFDGTLPGQDWFDTAGFPNAEFKTDTVALVQDTTYQADGTLTIKGASHPVTLQFTLEIDGDTAAAKGTAVLSRLDYGLGAGVGPDTVGDMVTVILDLTAHR